MNQGRIWTVVSPNHGLPLFLGSVALMSFTVHFAVLSSTTWMSDLYNGKTMGMAAAAEAPIAPVAKLTTAGDSKLAVEVVEATELTTQDGASFVVTIKPKIKNPDLAMATPG